MKIETTTVTKLKLTELERLDPVTVILENHEPGKGKIIIECYGKSWSSYWGAMGGGSIEQFFVSCGDDYLIGNLSSCRSTITADVDVIQAEVRKQIITLRREGELDHDRARDLYDQVEWLEISGNYCSNHELMDAAYGDDWHYNLPEVPNPDYQYLQRIVAAVQAGLREYMKQGEAA